MSSDTKSRNLRRENVEGLALSAAPNEVPDLLATRTARDEHELEHYLNYEKQVLLKQRLMQALLLRTTCRVR